MELSGSLKLERASEVYRKLATKFHPDHNPATAVVCVRDGVRVSSFIASPMANFQDVIGAAAFHFLSRQDLITYLRKKLQKGSAYHRPAGESPGQNPGELYSVVLG